MAVKKQPPNGGIVSTSPTDPPLTPKEQFLAAQIARACRNLFASRGIPLRESFSATIAELDEDTVREIAEKWQEAVNAIFAFANVRFSELTDGTPFWDTVYASPGYRECWSRAGAINALANEMLVADIDSFFAPGIDHAVTLAIAPIVSPDKLASVYGRIYAADVMDTAAKVVYLVQDKPITDPLWAAAWPGQGSWSLAKSHIDAIDEQSITNQYYFTSLVFNFSPPATGNTNRLKPTPRYRAVKHDGIPYTFTRQQAEIVRYMHEKQNNEIPCLHETEILEAVGSNSDRLRDSFRNKGKMHVAWGKLIIDIGHGFYRLDI